MKYYRPRIDPRRKRFVDLVGLVHLEIDNAITEENVSRAELARVLESHKSVLTRRLRGTSNMTLKAIADLAWALGRDIQFALPKRKPTNAFVERPAASVHKVSPTVTKADPTITGTVSARVYG
jgi:hypothetical protein